MFIQKIIRATLVIALSTLSSGCIVGGTVLLQRGISAQTYNLCTKAPIEVYSPLRGDRMIARIPYGQHVSIPIEQLPFRRHDSPITATIKMISKGRPVVVAETFHEHMGGSSQAVAWIIGDDQEGNGQNVHFTTPRDSYGRSLCDAKS